MRVTMLLGLGVGTVLLHATFGTALRGQPAEDPALLRELAERLLDQPVRLPQEAASGAARTRLFAGSMPPDLPVTLPLPPGGRLLGSLARPSVVQGPGVLVLGQYTEVVLDAPGEALAILAFFDDALTEHG